MLTAIIILALLDLGFLALNIHFVKAIMESRERKLLRKLRRYRSTKLGRLYRKALGKKAGDVLAFPNQHYINNSQVA